MFMWFLMLVALAIDIAAIVDVVRRPDLSVGARTLWIVFLIVLPVLGVIVYLIARPRVVEGEEHREEAIRARAESAELERERESDERWEERR